MNLLIVWLIRVEDSSCYFAFAFLSFAFWHHQNLQHFITTENSHDDKYTKIYVSLESSNCLTYSRWRFFMLFCFCLFVVFFLASSKPTTFYNHGEFPWWQVHQNLRIAYRLISCCIYLNPCTFILLLLYKTRFALSVIQPILCQKFLPNFTYGLLAPKQIQNIFFP